ncbi:MAG: hypothetical protein ACE14S_00625 [Candidatus Bathyarchaeia archaeon]
MEDYDRFVKKLIESFNASGLVYTFTGALAVSFYGAPRTTSDVDIMVATGGETDVKRKSFSLIA